MAANVTTRLLDVMDPVNGLIESESKKSRIAGLLLKARDSEALRVCEVICIQRPPSDESGLLTESITVLSKVLWNGARFGLVHVGRRRYYDRGLGRCGDVQAGMLACIFWLPGRVKLSASPKDRNLKICPPAQAIRDSAALQASVYVLCGAATPRIPEEPRRTCCSETDHDRGGKLVTVDYEECRTYGRRRPETKEQQEGHAEEPRAIRCGVSSFLSHGEIAFQISRTRDSKAGVKL